MELKIFKKKNVSFLEMLEFLVKFIFYIDTSELFIKEKKEKNLNRKSKSNTLSIFDYCFYSNSEIDKILNIISYQSGGASVASSAQSNTSSKATNATKASDQKSEASKEGADGKANNAEKKSNGEGSGEGGNEGGNEAGNDENTKKGLMDFIEEIKGFIMSGVLWVKTKVMAIISLIIYASIYPAIPFFLVMASLYGTLKYLMYKFRNF